MRITVEIEVDEGNIYSPEDTEDDLNDLLAGSDYFVMSVSFPE